MTLEQALKLAASEVAQSVDGRWVVDFGTFTRRFKEAWVYANNDLAQPALDAARGSLFFLFQKNLGVTNAQLIELLSLIRLPENHRKHDQTIKDIQFFSDGEYSKFFEFLWRSLLPSSWPTKAQLQETLYGEIVLFCKRYSELFESTCVLEVYFTSALLHVPPSLSVDIRSIVYESGYIHSAGAAIYVRNVEKVEQHKLFERIKSYLNDRASPIFVTPYADEFFKPHEQPYPVSVRNGLDGIRLQLRKHYVEGSPLLDFFSRLAQEFHAKLCIPQGLEHFRKEREASIDNELSSKDETLWFITDRGVRKRGKQSTASPSDDIYLFVYAQYLHNDNQLIAFKERKPAWYASVTLPHTLSAASINIARQFLPAKADGDYPIVLDPFCGTGTTLIDAWMRIKGVTVIGLDRDPIVKNVVEDNIEFFTRTSEAIEHFVQNDIESMINLLAGEQAPKLRPLTAATKNTWTHRLTSAIKVVKDELEAVRRGDHRPDSEIVKEILDNGFTDSFLSSIQAQDVSLDDRTIVYAVWRAIALGTFSLRGSDKDVFKVIKSELERMKAEFDYLARCIKPQPLGKCRAFDETYGLYSRAGIISIDSFKRLRGQASYYDAVAFSELLGAGITPGVHIARVEDSLAFMLKNPLLADIIITDPPYGFNTSEGGSDDLKLLFSELAEACLKCLRPGGQLILILPAFARNGRQIPFYETQGFVVRQIIAAGAKSGRRFVNPVTTVPGDKDNFQWPIYWRSTNVLERRVLKFDVIN